MLKVKSIKVNNLPGVKVSVNGQSSSMAGGSYSAATESRPTQELNQGRQDSGKPTQESKKPDVTATSTLSNEPSRYAGGSDAYKAAEAKTAFENKAFNDRKAAMDAANGYVKPKDPIYTATSTGYTSYGNGQYDQSSDAYKAANGKYDQTSNAYKADREARQKADLQNRAFFDQQAELKAKYGKYYTEPGASYKDVTKG